MGMKEWTKGMESPNPGGRPRGINQALRQRFGGDMELAFDWLKKRFTDGRTPASVKDEIAYFVIERFYGKAPQAVVNLNIDAEVKSLSDEEVYGAAAEIIRNDPRFAHLLPGGSGGDPVRSIEASGAVEVRKPI